MQSKPPIFIGRQSKRKLKRKQSLRFYVCPEILKIYVLSFH